MGPLSNLHSNRLKIEGIWILVNFIGYCSNDIGTDGSKMDKMLCQYGSRNDVRCIIGRRSILWYFYRSGLYQMVFGILLLGEFSAVSILNKSMLIIYKKKRI